MCINDMSDFFLNKKVAHITVTVATTYFFFSKPNLYTLLVPFYLSDKKKREYSICFFTCP
jgi:hypothetical protein